jgi:hypothetical protein
LTWEDALALAAAKASELKGGLIANGSVIKYEGRRGVVRRVKYRDANGRQVQETLGPERDGWNRKRAESELRDRLVKVEKKGYRKPKALTFRFRAEAFFAEKGETRIWKPWTVAQYRASASA